MIFSVRDLDSVIVILSQMTENPEVILFSFDKNRLRKSIWSIQLRELIKHLRTASTSTASPQPQRMASAMHTRTTSPTSTISKIHSPQILAEVCQDFLSRFSSMISLSFRWKIIYCVQFQRFLKLVQSFPKEKFVVEVEKKRRW